MSNTTARRASESETAVDDVRRVREQIHRESGGDVRKHVAESNRFLAERREALGLAPEVLPAAHTANIDKP